MMNDDMFKHKKMFMYTKRSELMALPPEQRLFVSNLIMREVDKAAKEHDIPKELAYELYSKGLFDADRDVIMADELESEAEAVAEEETDGKIIKDVFPEIRED